MFAGRNQVPRTLAVLACIFAWIATQSVSAADDSSPTVIRDVTVISPDRPAPLEHAYVRLEKGRIAEVSRRPLRGGVEIDGRGKFLIPGLIDTHTHLRQVPGMLAAQRSAHPDLVALQELQE